MIQSANLLRVGSGEVSSMVLEACTVSMDSSSARASLGGNRVYA